MEKKTKQEWIDYATELELRLERILTILKATVDDRNDLKRRLLDSKEIANG